MIDTNPFSAEAYRERAAVRLAIGDKEGHDEDMRKANEILPTEDKEDIGQKVEQKYKDMNPYGF